MTDDWSEYEEYDDIEEHGDWIDDDCPYCDGTGAANLDDYSPDASHICKYCGGTGTQRDY